MDGPLDKGEASYFSEKVGKDERVAAEGTANPAFNISCTDLSAYQTSEEEVIRHDKLDSTLAAHREKRRLQTRNEPRGNECSRNYFDPLMDEEINPRQCGMEVTKEDSKQLKSFFPCCSQTYPHNKNPVRQVVLRVYGQPSHPVGSMAEKELEPKSPEYQFHALDHNTTNFHFSASPKLLRVL
ncbi:hypothetical protein EYD10_05669 [Varanus komodoensis]|nr:hypothetical protein EYD10_05669 [Varanus komodoensis]